MPKTKTPSNPTSTTPNTPAGAPTGTGPSGSGGPIVGDPIRNEGGLGAGLGELLTTRGKVAAFTVDESRLMIKLNVSAISRMLVVVGADEPHFKTAVSLAMMAHNNDAYLSVRYFDRATRYDLLTEGPETMVGKEFGLGEDAFEIEDWPFKYHG